jgi:PAS domain-containing protein
MSTQQKPLELILARNLITAISTPAFLVDVPGQIIFFNEAAGSLFGRRFEETGPISHDEWRETVGPFDGGGDPIPFLDLPLTQSLRRGVAGHHRHMLRPAGGELEAFEVSGVPIVATGGGFRGAMVFFWKSDEAG